MTGSVWLASELTASPVLLGLLGLFRGVPAIALGPITGVVADRVDQRRLLFVTQATAMVVSFAFGVLVALGLVQLWHLYAQAAIQAVVDAFDSADRQAMFPRLVPKSYRAEAVTLASVAGRSAKFVGPSIGGLAVATMGVAAPFFLNAATFLALMCAAVLIRGIEPRRPAIGSSVTRELADGARYVAQAPILSGLLKMQAAYSLFAINPVMITIFGRQVLRVGPEGLGGLLSAPSLGALLGLAYLVLLRGAARQGRFMVLCTGGYAIGLLMFAASPDYGLCFAVLTLVGLFDVLVSVSRQSVIHLTTPGRLRGRVLGITRTVTEGMSQFAQTQSGIFAALLGAPLALVAAAGVLAVSAWTAGRTNPALWSFSHEPTTRAPILPADNQAT